MAALPHSRTPFPWATATSTKDAVPTYRPSHGNRSHSGSTSSTNSNKIKIIDLTQHEASMKKGMAYQERYLSSEEELSPLDEDFDDAGSFKSFGFDDEHKDEQEEEEEEEDDIDKAVSAYADDTPDSWRDELAARVISIIYSGRPKVVDISPTPTASPTAAEAPVHTLPLKSSRNWSRPSPMPQHSRVSRLSLYAFPDAAPRPDADQISIPESQRSDRRHSSIYSVASPPSPRFFNPLRRNSVADRSSIVSESPGLGVPAVPALPATVAAAAAPAPHRGETKLRHSRIKSISRMGFFRSSSNSNSNSSKKERKENLSSASMLHLADTTAPPPAPTRAPPPPSAAALARSSTSFAPPPFIRVQGRLVARGAGEREQPAWSSMLDGHGTAHARPYDSYGGDDELSDDEYLRGHEPDVAAKIRKRRSVLGLNY